MRKSDDRHVLSALRKAIAPMEQWRLAKLVGCSVETVRKIEKGKLALSESLAAKIAIATDVSEQWLLENKLKSQPYTRWGESFTKETYEHHRAFLRAARTEYSQASMPDRLFAYYQILRVVLAKLDQAKESIAIYKIEEFLKSFVREFTGETLEPDAGVNPLIHDLIEGDLKSAKELRRSYKGKTVRTPGPAKLRTIAIEMKKRVAGINHTVFLPWH